VGGITSDLEMIGTIDTLQSKTLHSKRYPIVETTKTPLNDLLSIDPEAEMLTSPSPETRKLQTRNITHPLPLPLTPKESRENEGTNRNCQLPSKTDLMKLLNLLVELLTSPK
jgi:hypothetical protein